MTLVPELIVQYERHELDRIAPKPVDPAALLDGLEFVRVRGISAFWRSEGMGEYSRHAVDLAVSAHAYETWFVFVLAGTPEHLQVYLALDRPGTVSRLSQSAYPGLVIEPGTHSRLGSSLRERFAHAGMLSGVPTSRHRSPEQGTADRDETAHLSRVVRGMRGATWAVVVRAHPCQVSQAQASREMLLGQLAQVLPGTRRSVQRTVQETKARTEHVSQSVSDVVGGDIRDRQAEYLAELLEHELTRLDEALALGQWQVAMHYAASDAGASRRLAGLLSGALSGSDSKPDRIRVIHARADATADETRFHTLLSSQEVGILTELPREEVPGYRVSDFAPFDVDFEPAARTLRKASLGQILRDGTDTGTSFEICLEDLAKHGLVAGVTGSGKTTTVRSLLNSVAKAGVPFLVIEPAKTEYRAMLGRVEHAVASGPLPRLRIYTLGNDRVSPFRLNPFEFETDDDPASPLLQSHINLLKAGFNAAFVLYAPMPYVLDMALHEVYEDKGWSLATGQNLRIPAQQWSLRDRFPIFPTLTDLYRKVEVVTRRLGYEARIEQDVSAGLKARIGSLRIGSKGLMLDVPRGNPMSELLRESVVLELESIGNDDEKAFIIGLILARLYEFRRLQATRGAIPGGLQHVVVVEEAHRLLRRMNTDVDTESSSLRAQAVETFVNMLSEVRRYGQGLLVAEQIPSKLAPDAVKNANLKVVHRLVAEDDRALLAGSTNMSDAQSRELATLVPGRAAVFAEGADHPYLVDVHDVLAEHGRAGPSDQDVADLAAGYVSLGGFLSVPDFARFGVPSGPFGAPEALLYQRALQFVTADENAAAWSRIVVRTIYARAQLPAELSALERTFAASSSHLTGGQIPVALRLAVALGAGQAIYERAAEYGWSFPLADSLRESLTTGLLYALRAPESTEATQHLDRFARSYEASTARKHGPYPGCPECPSICRFRSDVRRMLTPVTVRLVSAMIAAAAPSTKLQRYAEVSTMLRASVGSWLGVPMTGTDGFSYCSALTAAAEGGMDTYQQAELARQIAPHVL